MGEIKTSRAGVPMGLLWESVAGHSANLEFRPRVLRKGAGFSSPSPAPLYPLYPSLCSRPLPSRTFPAGTGRAPIISPEEQRRKQQT